MGLGMGSKNTGIMSQITSDCCTGLGVVCVGGRVVEILWGRLGLNGYINGSALPSSTKKLWLNSNDLVGSIPSNLPSGLTDLIIDGNQMTGEVPLLPDSLKYLYLGTSNTPGNRFAGSISLKQPVEVNIYGNLITEFRVANVAGFYGICVLSNNPILGGYDTSQLSMCIVDNIYAANLLPWTVSKITRSTVILLSSNPSTKFVTSKSMSLDFVVSSRTYTPYSLTDKIEQHFKSTSVVDAAESSFSTAQSSIFVEPDPQSIATSPFVGSVTFILIVIGIFFAVCLVILIAGRLIKSPEIKSKFARKNSNGTLNTVYSDIKSVNMQ